MTGHIHIYGEIGTGPGQVSLKNIKTQIEQEKGATDYVLHMFTPGGDVFEGYGIYNALKNTGKEITTQIEGLCASIGTLIAFAGNTIRMNRTSEFMIHNPTISDLKGDERALLSAVGQLKIIKNILVDVAGQRATRNGKPITKDELSRLYDNETWLTAQQALQIGFVDEVQDALKAVAKADLKNLTMEKEKTGLIGFFKSFINQPKIKNQFTETLADGRTIVVDSDDGNWTGKKVVTDTGEQLEPGEHQLASGKILVVGDGSTISEVKEAPAAKAEEAKPEEKPKEDEEMNNKIAELEAQLATLKGEKAAAEAKVVETEKAAAATTAKFENRVAEVEKKFLKLAEEAGKTVGDNTPPAKGPVIKNVGEGEVHDPMAAFAQKILKARSGN